MEFTNEQLLNIHHQLCFSRFFQKKLLDAGLNAYTEFGEEAISVGSALAMKDDIITCYFRGEGNALRIKGAISALDQMAWLLGRKGPADFVSTTLPSAWTNTECGVIGTTSSLIGADADVAVGAAMAQKMQKTGKVVMFMSGDGATSKGNFHELMNFSSLYKLPMIVMVRGNKWAMSTEVERNTHVSSIPDMARPFGFHIIEIDGNDICTVMEAAATAKELALAGTPVMIYADTYRISGHSGHDADEYRDPVMLEQWKAKDPVLKLEARMREAGIPDESILGNSQKAQNDIENIYKEALTFRPFTTGELLNRQIAVIDKMYGRCR